MLIRSIVLLFLGFAAPLPAQYWLLSDDYPLENFQRVRYDQVPDSLVYLFRPAGDLSLEEVSNLSDSFAVMPDRLNLPRGSIVWARISVKNPTANLRRLLFELDPDYDQWSEIEAYNLAGDTLREHLLTGNAIRPGNKPIRDNRNLVRLTVAPGARHTLNLRFTAGRDLERENLILRILDSTSMQDFLGLTLRHFIDSYEDTRFLIPLFRAYHGVEFVVDSSENFSFSRVRAEWDDHARFRNPSDYYASRRYATWSRLLLINPDDTPKNYVLDPSADDPVVEAYLPDANGNYRRLVTGKRIPYADKPLPGPMNYLEYTQPPSDSAYLYFRYHPLGHNKPFASNMMDSGVAFAEARTLLGITRRAALWKGAISGILLFQLFYFVLRSLMVRDLLELYYAGVVLGFSLLFIFLENRGNTFYAFQLFMEHSNLLLVLAFSLFSVGLYAFTNKYLDLKARFPTVFWLQSAVLLLILLLLTGDYVEEKINEQQFGPYQVYFPFRSLALLLIGSFVLVYLSTALIGHFRGLPYALTYLAAFSPFLLIAAANAFQNVNLGENPVDRTNMMYGGFIVTSVLFALISSKRHNEAKLREARAENLVRLNEAKSEFYSNITHEFRTPLTVMLGMANLIEGHPRETELIRKNGQDVLNLVQQLQDITKAQTGALQVKLVEDDIIPYLDYLIESFQPLAGAQSISLGFTHGREEIIASFDRQKLRFIVDNLVINAIKFSPAGGKVTVFADAAAGELLLSVTDTGVGLAPEERERIFHRYYRVQASPHASRAGDGIGLALVKELVELLGGGIRVESQQHVGSTFTLRLPLRPPAPVAVADLPPGRADDAPTALVVEDSADVQYYIRRILSPRYEVLCAEDGQAGFDLAVTRIPDVIVSDVMMPVLDGYALTEKLKTDSRTNHIPIILLTAKTTQEERVKGLTLGADAYLTKPFDEGELLVRVDTLIERRRKFQTDFAGLSPSTNRQECVDPFLAEALQLLADHYAEEDFGISEFVRLLPLSRMQIHRKLKALTGHSTSQFINQFRLRKAREYLDGGGMNVSETAYACGFSDPGYFSKLFARQYGVSPSAYRTQA